MYPVTRCVGNPAQGYVGCGRDFPRKAVPGLCGICFDYRDGGSGYNEPAQCKLCGCAASLRYRIHKSKCDDCRSLMTQEKWASNDASDRLYGNVVPRFK